MWTRGQSSNERPLPDRFRTVRRLYVRGQTMAMPNNQQPHAYVCIGFRRHIVQRMEFDDHVDYEKNWNDKDNCAYRSQCSEIGQRDRGGYGLSVLIPKV
jgi:hypothetical protein